MRNNYTSTPLPSTITTTTLPHLFLPPSPLQHFHTSSFYHHHYNTSTPLPSTFTTTTLPHLFLPPSPLQHFHTSSFHHHHYDTSTPLPSTITTATLPHLFFPPSSLQHFHFSSLLPPASPIYPNTTSPTPLPLSSTPSFLHHSI
ncbi:hypothetical protein Pcinc_041704 [Petrolisthes cinctipes]|uniref:Uncharacterized protein n=1 Tax=Petrolisthes cinctipes TaxID=88211 RepID=A0AAE1BMQ0_PETCI|nr:hypothetical protein Pcinc_041704 [Petrolisthes cinctipes]